MVTTPNSTRKVTDILSPIRVYSSGGALTFTSPKSSYALTEKRLSSGHPIPKNGGGWSGDIGGPFYHYKQTVTTSGSNVSIIVPSGANKGQRLSGMFVPENGTGIQNRANGVGITEPSNTVLNAEGTTCIAQCNPDNPSFGLAAFLGEAHEGFPKLCGTDFFKSRASHFKNLGGEYLNVKFGWQPFVSDLKKAAHAVTHSHEVIHKYQEQSGKLIRRRFALPSTATSSSSVLSTVATPGGPMAIPGQFAGPGHCTYTVDHSTEVRAWFSGAFTVYLDPGTTQMGKLERHYQEAQHLLGVGLTPDVVWELTPWSWLADWYTNIGDVMTNVRAFCFDGMVMPYGYIMHETKTVDTYSMQGSNIFVDGSGYNGSLRVESKMQNRLQANPFGFGLTKANLSARQIAILAALGLVLLL
jgi:hypothetical protein